MDGPRTGAVPSSLYLWGVPRAARTLLWALPLLAIAAMTNRDRLNTDAIAYLRLGGYYADGRFDLAVSGYWGPLLPWMLAPLLRVGADPLAAARAAMALSGALFLWGAIALLRALRVRSRAADGVAALFAVVQSVSVIAPDLLLSGLLSLALARMIARRWAGAGLLGGIAFLAKPVGLPLTVVLALVAALLPRLAGARVGGRPWLALLGCGSVAILWGAVLTAKYGTPTLSTSPSINHAIVGPEARPPAHPFDTPRHPFAVGLRRPEPGRVTEWEDPPAAAYRGWSPLAHPGHQLRLLRDNLHFLFWQLLDFDLLHLGWVAALGGLLFARPWRAALARDRWRWSGPFVAAVALVYLPVYASIGRYYWVAWPLLLAAGVSVARDRRILGSVMLLSFALPSLLALPATLRGRPDPAVAEARACAERLAKLGERGPVAGNGPEGLFTAFFLGEPWLGAHAASPTAVEIEESGARLAVQRRGGPLGLPPGWTRIVEGPVEALSVARR